MIKNHIIRSVCRSAIVNSCKHFQSDKQLQDYMLVYNEILDCVESYFLNFKASGISFDSGNFGERVIQRFSTVETKGNLQYAQCVFPIKTKVELDAKKLKKCAVNASKAFVRELMKCKHISVLNSNLKDNAKLNSSIVYSTVEAVSDSKDIDSRIRLNPMIQFSIIDDSDLADYHYVLVFVVKACSDEIH